MTTSATPTDRILVEGFDNYKKPRQNYADKLAAMSNQDFISATEDAIWHSAYASNRPGADAHWQTTVCYQEALRRGDEGLYRKAYKRVSGDPN